MGGPDDQVEMDRLIGEFFRAVSFEPAARPPYHLIRDLFLAGGLLIRSSGTEPEVSTVDEFIAPRLRLVESGELTSFRETELTAVTEVFGNVAHRFGGYHKAGVTGGVPFEARGMISTQFARTPAGWRISVMAWDDERPGLVVPRRYR